MKNTYITAKKSSCPGVSGKETKPVLMQISTDASDTLLV